MVPTSTLSLLAAAGFGAIVATALPDLGRADPPPAPPGGMAVAFPCAPMPVALDAVDALALTPAASFRDGAGDPWAIFAGADGRVVLGFRTGGVFCGIGGTDWSPVDAPVPAPETAIRPGARR